MVGRKNIIPKELLTPYQRWELASFDEEEEAPALPPEEQEEEEPPPPVLTEEELNAIREHARQEAYAEGLQQGQQAGHTEGYAAGLQQGQDEINTIIEHFRQITTTFATEVEQCSETIAPELLDLTLDLTKAMLKTAISMRPELVLPIVNAAIHALPSLQLPAQLFLHHDDAAIVREHMGEELNQSGWRIIEDPELDRGGCRIETSTNQIDATTQTRWRRIAESFGQQLDWLE